MHNPVGLSLPSLLTDFIWFCDGFGHSLAHNSQPVVYRSQFLDGSFRVARRCVTAAESVSHYERW